MIYIDDILLLAATPLELSQAINDTISLLRSLGFTIHDTKSVTMPTQVVNFLGFVFNSQNMTISMVPGKADMIKSKCHTLVHMQGPVQNREVASVVPASWYQLSQVCSMHLCSIGPWKMTKLML